MAPTRTLIVLAVLLAALLFAPSLAATDPPPSAPKGEYYSFFSPSLKLRTRHVS